MRKSGQKSIRSRIILSFQKQKREIEIVKKCSALENWRWGGGGLGVGEDWGGCAFSLMPMVALSLSIGPTWAFPSYYGDTGPDWPRLSQRLHFYWSTLLPSPPPHLLEGGGNDRPPLVRDEPQVQDTSQWRWCRQPTSREAFFFFSNIYIEGGAVTRRQTSQWILTKAVVVKWGLVEFRAYAQPFHVITGSQWHIAAVSVKDFSLKTAHAHLHHGPHAESSAARQPSSVGFKRRCGR